MIAQPNFVGMVFWRRLYSWTSMASRRA